MKKKQRKIARRPNELGKERVYFGDRRIIKRRRRTKNSFHVKFTRRRRLIIFAALSKGLTLSASARLAALAPSSVFTWMKRGEDPDQFPTYYLFRLKVKRIQAEVEQKSLDIILAAQQGGANVSQTKIVFGPKGTEVTKIKKTLGPSWNAAAWFLERRYKDKYGKDSNPEQDRTAEDLAREVRDLAKSLFESVPITPETEGS